MKRLVSVVILAGLLLVAASPSAAAKRAEPTASAATADALRGPLGPAKPAKPTRPLQSPIPALASTVSPLAPPPVSADSCRLACARTYYFCLAGENPDQCSQEWISCRIPCAPSGGSVGARP